MTHIPCLALVAIAAGALLLAWRVHAEARNERKDLLNRLMARDYGEYKVLSAPGAKPPRRISMTDELEVEIEKRQKVLAEAGRHA